MDSYKGQIKLETDGPSNLGAINQLLDYIRSTVDYSKCSNQEERRLLRQNVELNLRKVLSGFVPKMVFENFIIDTLVGHGSFGKIWKAEGRYTGDVALKQLPVDNVSVRDIWKERDILIMLKHERVCNLVGAFFHVDAFLVMELCYGSVNTLRNRIKTSNAVRFSIHLLQALAWIHSKRIIHADVKSDNCLINSRNNLVLSDFGSAMILEDGEESVISKDTRTPGYLDLLAVRENRFSTKTDIFSAGCVIFEMDAKGCLLLYNTTHHTKELYLDAFENGRVIGLLPNTSPSSGMDREFLSERAMLSKFGFLIQKMISDENRLTAEQALIDETLRVVMVDNGVSFQDENSEFLTREYNMDTSQNFSFFGEETSSTKNPSMLAFYYDQEEEEETKSPTTLITDGSDSDNNGDDTDNDDTDEDRGDVRYPAPVPVKKRSHNKSPDLEVQDTTDSRYPAPVPVFKRSRNKSPERKAQVSTYSRYPAPVPVITCTRNKSPESRSPSPVSDIDTDVE